MRKGMIFIGLFLLAGSALAQGTAGTVELTPLAGYWFGDTFTRGTISGVNFDVRIDDAPAYGVRIAYKFTDVWALDGLMSCTVTWSPSGVSRIAPPTNTSARIALAARRTACAWAEST